MTAKCKAIIRQFHADQFALRDKMRARLSVISPDDRLKFLVDAGVLTKGGKLTASYRPSRSDGSINGSD